MPLIRRSLLAVMLTAALATPALAAAHKAHAQKPLPGGDAKARPQDDLFRFANGQWLDQAKIPGDKRAYGTFMILREKSDADVRVLLEQAAKSKAPDANSRLIGDYFASLSDLDTIEKAGLAALQSELVRIEALSTPQDVAAAMGALQHVGVGGPVATYVYADEKNPGMNVVYWTQSGLGMPDRDYYLKDGAESQKLRDAYHAYLTELHTLAGTENPTLAARTTQEFETALAKIQWTKVERRDALKTYNPAPRARWTTDYAGLDWEAYAKAADMPQNLGTIINEASYVKAFGPLAAATPISTWKVYLKSRLLDTYAEYMAPRFRQAHHRFHGEKLQGLTEMPPVWRSAVSATNEALGEAIGERYVAKHFPPAAKARMATLVSNLKKAYGEGLTKLAWMTPKTRTAALEKLAKFRVKIGYPEQWRGYKGLVVKRDDALGNVMRSARFTHARDMAEAGKPVDRARWHMTPQTVNAYYSPVGNEIVFPAAILQSPFFDMKRDDAYNYGGIGAVIGHEISHGFDDQGRRYDGEGKLRDWWTPADEKAFNARAEKLIAQYAAYEPLPGAKVDGRLTLGENIADLAGVQMAHRAYQFSLGKQKPRIVDGRTADQRFFLGYAQNWRSKSRPEWLRMRLVSDPHSPEQYRTNGVVTNLDSYYKAYGLKPGDKLYRKPEDRVRIW